MWNSHPPLSLLETMGEGRVAPYAVVWVCVVRARMYSHSGGLSPCMRVCPSGQPGCMCLVCVCVCVCVTVSGLCMCVWASVCLYLSAFVMLLKAVLPLMLNRVFQAPG